MQATYLIEGEILGIIEAPPLAQPHAFFCKTCGRIWATIETQGIWKVVSAPCEQHSSIGVEDWNRIPGSILERDPPVQDSLRALAHIPPRVLSRELSLHLAEYLGAYHAKD